MALSYMVAPSNDFLSHVDDLLVAWDSAIESGNWLLINVGGLRITDSFSGDQTESRPGWVHFRAGILLPDMRSWESHASALSSRTSHYCSFSCALR